MFPSREDRLPLKGIYDSAEYPVCVDLQMCNAVGL
jgi:hypothetical protein